MGTRCAPAKRDAEILSLLERDAGKRWKKPGELFRKVLDEVDGGELEFAVHVQVPERLTTDKDRQLYLSVWNGR